MPQTNPLFTAADLANLLQRPVSDAAAEMAEKIVWGRIRSLLKLTERPATLDESLAGLVLELGALVVTNPEALAEYALESETSQYDTSRWNELLEAIATGGVVAPGGVPAPQGRFPAARCYPDPAERGRGRWYW